MKAWRQLIVIQLKAGGVCSIEAWWKWLQPASWPAIQLATGYSISAEMAAKWNEENVKKWRRNDNETNEVIFNEEKYVENNVINMTKIM